MFTNEQRAHDLAIAILPKTIDWLINEKIREADASKNPSEIVIDVYKEYKKLYDLSLEAINRDFPKK